ncbi:uncharacterized protein LOC108090333 isoform X2 [Drosophila ficusphila]|uniref:uncharacterized protein LOC108090333 isoform X2 n=1 Tax=Drosophila ficusphila TaxID=30025 RepID=UPI0007E653AC|nr:uncharacterized protein LOC108090333 isoform X2 [Drosophila ficusphila]
MSCYLFVEFCLLFLLFSGCEAARKWEYELLSLEVFSSNPKLMKIEAKVVRMGRSEIGLSATLDLNYDVTDETTIEVIAYRSNSGDEGDYKMLPWAAPKQPYYEYLNTYYKDFVMKDFASCSNLPQFKDKFQPPVQKKKYYAEKCMVIGEGLPDIVPPGYYKLIFNCTKPDEPYWGFIAIVRITTKLF